MVGSKEDYKKLNDTLLKITEIFFINNIEEWFVVYGTLLGILRKNSCIDGDDDIDLICNQENYIKLTILLLRNGFELDPKITSPYILKTLPNKNYASIDIYMAAVDEHKNYIDLWEHIIWENCCTPDNEFIKRNIEKEKINYDIYFHYLEYLAMRLRRKIIYIFFKKLIKLKPRWQMRYINLPQNSELMLNKVYGKDWITEKNTNEWTQIRDYNKPFTNY